MQRIFLDANVFFAAVASRSGGSYFIIELAKKGLLNVITVAHALAEAERNIERKLGEQALCVHYDNLIAIQPTVQSLEDIPSALEQKLSVVVPEKDVPILAGAMLSGADALITLDRKHLLKNEKITSLRIQFLILTPGDFIQKYFR